MRIRGLSLVVPAVALAVVTAASGVACTDLGGLAGDDSLPTKDAGPRQDGGDVGELDGDLVLDDSGMPVATPRCDPNKPFGSPELVNELDATSDFVKDAVLSQDELEVLYLRYLGSGNWELRHARRATRDDKWGAATTEAITPSPDGVLSLTASDRKLYFWTIDADYRTSRATTSAAFTAPVTYFAPNTPQAFFVAADDTAYFATFDSDGGATDDKSIKRCGTSSTGLSSTSVQVPNIHAANTLDSHPVLNASETAIYFSSNRTGTLGLDDIWVSRRPSKQAEFGQPAHVPELSTVDPDVVTWIAADDCQVLLDRASHVYVARRPL